MSNQKASERTLIIGAGMAGLTAASLLKKAGQDVLLLDKGRGVGGRMATRRFGNGRFDHGAQYFTIRDERFKQMVTAWEQAETAVQWSQGFASYPGEKATGQYPRYRGHLGMTDIPKHLAKGLYIQLETKVTAVHQENDQWRLETEAGEQIRGRALLMTSPVPQTLALLDAGGILLPKPIRKMLDAVEYYPCLALMALYAEPSRIPAPGGLRFAEGPIAWMADNHQKGISPDGFAVTIHASPEFSQTHWQTDSSAVVKALMDAASPWLPQNPIDWQLHRWRYAQVKTMGLAPMYCLPGKPTLALAGDAFGGARVEGAVLSGFEVARVLLEI